MQKTLKLILYGLLLAVVLSGCAQNQNKVETDIEENSFIVQSEKIDETLAQSENFEQNENLVQNEMFESNENFEQNEMSAPNGNFEQNAIAEHTESFEQSEVPVQEETIIEPDLSGLSDEKIKQLEIFATNKDVWNVKGDMPRAFYFAVFDLDSDGSLELITSAISGTGQYSRNHFYCINDEIEELPQEYLGEKLEPDSELDINLYDYEYAYTDGKQTYYPASDFTRDGFRWSASADGAYYLRDGTVYIDIYRSDYTLCSGDGETTCYNADGNEITKEAWEKLEKDFYAGMEQIAYPICWEWISPEELEQDAYQKVFNMLVENYKNGIVQITR
ncbi:MAG: hypothetical protein NC433_03200 [Clostridiales bacterium]|nr:hypothetical protein [Clostridiales bacterium]